MGTSQPDGEEKGDMDDSGCVQDGSPPVKKPAVETMDTNDAMGNDYQRLAQLLDLSDDVLLYILKHCSPRDLKALGYTCTRLGALVRDRTLWQAVDTRQQPYGRARLRWLLSNVLNDGTTELLLCGYAREARGCLGHVTRAPCDGDDKRGDADNNNDLPSTSGGITEGISVENSTAQMPSAEGTTANSVAQMTPAEGAPVDKTPDNAPQESAPVDKTPDNASQEGAPVDKAAIIAPQEGAPVDKTPDNAPQEGAPVDKTPNNASQEDAPTNNATGENSHLGSASGSKETVDNASLEIPLQENAPVEGIPLNPLPEIAQQEIAPQDVASTALAESAPAVSAQDLRTENTSMEVAPAKSASLDAAPTKNAGGIPPALAGDLRAESVSMEVVAAPTDNAPVALAEGAPSVSAPDLRTENPPAEVAPPEEAPVARNQRVFAPGSALAALAEFAVARADMAGAARAERPGAAGAERGGAEMAGAGGAERGGAEMAGAGGAERGGAAQAEAPEEELDPAVAARMDAMIRADLFPERPDIFAAAGADLFPAARADRALMARAEMARAEMAAAARAALARAGVAPAEGAPPHRNGRAEPPYPLARQHARLHISASQQLPRFSVAPNWSDDTEPHHADAHVHTDSSCAGPQFTLSQQMLKELQEHCTKLTSLSLEYCNINCKKTGINHLPPTLKKLSLRGTKCYNLPLDKSFLFKIHDYLPALEYLDVSESEWMEPASLLPLSKAPLLLTLIMRDCTRMTEFVAYASLATRYGFRKLKVLDMRGSPVGDSEVSAFGWVPELEELYLAPVSSPEEPVAEHSHFKGDALPPHNELEPWEIEEEPMYLLLNDGESVDTSLDDLDEQEEFMGGAYQHGSDFNIMNEGVRIEVSLRASNGDAPAEQMPQGDRFNIRRRPREDGSGDRAANQDDLGPGPSKRKTSEESSGEKKVKTETEDGKMADDKKNDDCDKKSGDTEMADAKNTEDAKAQDNRDVQMADDTKAADTSGDKSKRKGKRKTASPNKIDRNDGKSKRKRHGDVNQGASTSRASTSRTIDIRLEFHREPVDDPNPNRNPDENANEPSNGEKKSDSDSSDDDDDSPKKRKVAARAARNEVEHHGHHSIEVKVEVSQGREMREQDGQGDGQNRQDQAENDQGQAQNAQDQAQNAQVQGQNDQVQGQNDQVQGQNDQAQGENGQGDGQNDQVHVQARERRGSHDRRGRRGHSRRRRFENIVRFRQDQDPVIIQCPILPQRQEVEQPENQEGEPRHHILYVNVGQQLHAVYRLLPSRPIFHSMRNRNWRPNIRNVFYSPAQPHVHSASLVTDSAIRRFGRADGDQINYVNIGPNGPYPAARDAAGRPVGLLGARDLGARPDRSNLRVLSVTGYRHITDRSLVHLSTSAPHLRLIDFSNSGVTEQGVENFRNFRPECEVKFSPFVEKNDNERTE